jgi:hypothetical protein
LNQSDEKKVQGLKLIQMIYSIEKYKAYQNVSLHLFDQNSLLVYEDEEQAAISEGAINGKQRVNQIYTSARGGSFYGGDQHSIANLLSAL